MPVEFSALQVAFVLFAVVIAGVLQGSLGFGFSFIAVPAMTLVEPRALPVTIIMVSLPVTIFMAHRERASVDAGGLLVLTAGRMVGTVAGLWVLTLMSPNDMAAFTAGAILAAVATSILVSEPRSDTTTRLVAGMFSGAMGTAAALGGPPLALAYQSQPGPVVRSTLAVSFLVGSAMSLTGLIAVGRVALWHVQAAAFLLLPAMLGLLLSKHTIRWVDAGWLR
ncbi:MAG: TSUP family transporter, partial [Actinobacteria bacterium]|nr:TSUP family transporter [Actinomycetota bacterium]